MSNKLIFCANDQKDTTQTFLPDPLSDDMIATCPCGRQLKFPGDPKTDLTELLIAQKQDNLKQEPAEPPLAPAAVEPPVDSVEPPAPPREVADATNNSNVD